ncbi:MAG: hypothetical protein ACOH1N_12165 [Lutibacter sp.]
MKKTGTLLLFLAILTSCKTVVVNKQTQKIAFSALELATIGKTKPNLQINNFEINAIPQLNQKIRITSKVLPFSRTTFKAYKRASKLQGKKVTIKYVDSLSQKPTFAVLKIVDQVTLLQELNAEYNSTVFNYLKTVPKASIITSISMAFEPSILEEINQADELYLSNIKFKKYELELYKNKKLHKTIELTKGTVFTYELASFCWGKTRYQPILVNIISEHSKCENSTYNSYQLAEKEKHSIKY